MSDFGDSAREKRSSRREVLRKSAALGAAGGVAWAEPRVEGLSLRPDYAAAQSVGAGPCAGGCVDVTVPVQFVRGFNSSSFRAGAVTVDGSCVGGVAAGWAYGAPRASSNFCQQLDAASNSAWNIQLIGPGLVPAGGDATAENCRLEQVTISPADLGGYVGFDNLNSDRFGFRATAVATQNLTDRCRQQDVTWNVQVRMCCD